MMALSNEELLLLGATAVALVMKGNNNKKKKKQRKWNKDLLKRKKMSHISLLEELEFLPSDWSNYLRMDQETYLELLSLVTPHIEKKDTNMRQAITPHKRLTATLCFLATGRAYEDLKFSLGISPQSLGRIIPETCTAIQRVLQQYMKFPDTEEEWKEVSTQFNEVWNFPNCLGAADGKHVNIVPPPDSGSCYYNYKGSHSMVLMAVVKADYEFILCDFGVSGRVSDGGYIENTPFYHKLREGTLSLPNPQPPHNSQVPLPFVFVGDEPFPLRKDFLKPFNQKELDHDKRIFNYRLSRARSVVENVFRMLSKRFGIFSSPINMKVNNIQCVVMACCYLHNFLRRKISNYITREDVIQSQEASHQTESTPFIDLERTHSKPACDEAMNVREMFQRYINNEGAVLGQENMIQ